MTVQSLLVAGRVPPDRLDELRGRLPGVRVSAVRAGEAMPPEAADATVLVAAALSSDQLRTAVDALPQLLWVHTVSAGADRYVPVLRGRGVLLTRTVHARAAAMSEHVVSMALALLRDLPGVLESQRQQEWRRREARLLSGSTVGIVGAGTIGAAAAQRFAAFGATCLGTKREPTPLPGFDEVLPPTRVGELVERSDVIVVACPLTEETRGLLDAGTLSRAKPGAVLVDVSRGGVVVGSALLAALREGRLAGAALDVFEVEPLPQGHPFWTLPNVIVTPHSSAAAPGVWNGILDELMANLGRYQRGEPLAGVLDVEGRGY